MPIAVESIQPTDTIELVRRKISESIQKLIDEGKDPKSAAGQAYSMAEKAWGKAIPRAH